MRAKLRMVTSLSSSYKETSEAGTDSEDLMEVEQAAEAAAPEVSTAETIERVLKSRIGRKGGKILLVLSLCLSVEVVQKHCGVLSC